MNILSSSRRNWWAPVSPISSRPSVEIDADSHFRWPYQCIQDYSTDFTSQRPPVKISKGARMGSNNVRSFLLIISAILCKWLIHSTVSLRRFINYSWAPMTRPKFFRNLNEFTAWSHTLCSDKFWGSVTRLLWYGESLISSSHNLLVREVSYKGMFHKVGVPNLALTTA